MQNWLVWCAGLLQTVHIRWMPGNCFVALLICKHRADVLSEGYRSPFYPSCDKGEVGSFLREGHQSILLAEQIRLSVGTVQSHTTLQRQAGPLQESRNQSGMPTRRFNKDLLNFHMVLKRTCQISSFLSWLKHLTRGRRCLMHSKCSDWCFSALSEHQSLLEHIENNFLPSTYCNTVRRCGEVNWRGKMKTWSISLQCTERHWRSPHSSTAYYAAVQRYEWSVTVWHFK